MSLPNIASPRIVATNGEGEGVGSPDDAQKTKKDAGTGIESVGTETFSRGTFDISVHSRPESLFRSTSMDNLLSILPGRENSSLDNTTHNTIHDVLQTCIKVTNCCTMYHVFHSTTPTDLAIFSNLCRQNTSTIFTWMPTSTIVQRKSKYSPFNVHICVPFMR